MGLSVNAILCGRLRPGGKAGLWPAAMPPSGTAGAGAVLRAFANQSEPIPSPPVSGLQRSQRLEPTALPPHTRRPVGARPSRR